MYHMTCKWDGLLLCIFLFFLLRFSPFHIAKTHCWFLVSLQVKMCSGILFVSSNCNHFDDITSWYLDISPLFAVQIADTFSHSICCNTQVGQTLISWCKSTYCYANCWHFFHIQSILTQMYISTFWCKLLTSFHIQYILSKVG